MNGIKYLIVFSLGAVAGSLLSAKILDEKYSKIADEEIESVKAVTKKAINELKKKFENFKEVKVETTDTTYQNIVDKYNGEPEKKEKVAVKPKIEVISEEEYLNSDRKKMTLEFYGVDKTLVSDTGIIDNPIECIGENIFNNPDEVYFSKFTSIYVRNYGMNMDFEVVYYENQSYS